MVLRMLLVSLFGLNGGIGFMLVASSVSVWFASEKVSLTTIGHLSLLQQPYLFKFLWAPLVDTWLGRFADPKKAWVLICLAVMSLLLLVMSLLTLTAHLRFIFLLLFLFSLATSTHDVAADGKRIEILVPQERGLGANMTIVGFRVGMLLAGALVLIVADHYGWPIAWQLLVGCLLISACLITLIPSLPSSERLQDRHIWNCFRQCFARSKFLPTATVIFAYKMAEVFTTTASPMMGPFFLDQLHLSLSDIGLITKGVGIVATLAGGLVAGVALLRFALSHCLLLFAILQLLVNGLFILLAVYPDDQHLVIPIIFAENFVAGLGMTALVAYMMAWCDKVYAASQFAILAAISTLPRVIAGPLAAEVVSYGGWLLLFVVGAILAIPAIVLVSVPTIVSKPN